MISAATIAVFAFAICAQLVFYVVGKRAVRARAIAASAAASGAAPTSLWAQAASSTLPVSKAEEKARAWLLSLGISVLMSATGVIKVFEGVAALVTGGLNAFSLFVLSSDMIGEMMILFFMAFMCLDIAVGLLDYSALLRWDTGYVHHTVYFLICCGLVSARWTNAFLLFGLIEVPTGILALGSIADEYRNDILFRATFFVFRLVFFGIFSILLIACTLFASPTFPWYLSAATFPITAMHVKWFIGGKKSTVEGAPPASSPTTGSGTAPRVTFAAEISTTIDAEAHTDVQTVPLLGGSPPRPSSLSLPEEKLHAPPKLMKGTPAKQTAVMLTSPQAGRPTRVPKERQA